MLLNLLAPFSANRAYKANLQGVLVLSQLLSSVASDPLVRFPAPQRAADGPDEARVGTGMQRKPPVRRSSFPESRPKWSSYPFALFAVRDGTRCLKWLVLGVRDWYEVRRIVPLGHSLFFRHNRMYLPHNKALNGSFSAHPPDEPDGKSPSLRDVLCGDSPKKSCLPRFGTPVNERHRDISSIEG